jgi:hypothetical protein
MNGDGLILVAAEGQAIRTEPDDFNGILRRGDGLGPDGPIRSVPAIVKEDFASVDRGRRGGQTFELTHARRDFQPIGGDIDRDDLPCSRPDQRRRISAMNIDLPELPLARPGDDPGEVSTASET